MLIPRRPEWLSEKPGHAGRRPLPQGLPAQAWAFRRSRLPSGRLFALCDLAGKLGGISARDRRQGLPDPRCIALVFGTGQQSSKLAAEPAIPAVSCYFDRFHTFLYRFEQKFPRSPSAATPRSPTAPQVRNRLGLTHERVRSAGRLNVTQRSRCERGQSAVTWATFGALGDLWNDDPIGQPLLAGLCALARDSVDVQTAHVRERRVQL